MADDTVKLPQGQMMPGMMMPGMGQYPMPWVAPPIAGPMSNFQYGGYNPYFDGVFAHQLTTTPYVNYLNEATNITQFNIDRLAMFQNMQGGTPQADPNIAWFNSTLAGGLTSANTTFKDVMASTANAPAPQAPPAQ